MHITLQEALLGHSDNFRRTWDKDTYEKLAKERLKKDKDDGSCKLANSLPLHCHHE